MAAPSRPRTAREFKPRKFPIAPKLRKEPEIVQFSKLWGLKKLRLIAGNDPRFGVIKWFTFRNRKQAEARNPNAERLLLRTDENAKAHKRLMWHSMPRTEIFESFHSATPESEKLLSFLERNPARLIVHPTRIREKIAWTGQLKVGAETKWSEQMVRINLVKNPPTNLATDENALVHRNLFNIFGEQYSRDYRSGKASITLRFKISGNSLEPTKESREILDQIKSEKGASEIVGNSLEFLRRGINLRQIKFNRFETELLFVTFRDKPTFPEFYDLKEKRARPKP